MGQRTTFTALVAALILFVFAVASSAQSDGDYDLSWWTVDGGGVVNQSGQSGYSLSGTAGQPDAAVWSDGMGYVLGGGFWLRLPFAEYCLYLPVVMR